MTAASSSANIPQGHARIGFLAENAEKAAAALKTAMEWLEDKSAASTWEHPQGIYYRQSGLENGSKVVALFPGQGSQYVNMAREAAVNFPILREAFGSMDDLFIKDNLAPLSGYVYPVPGFSTEAEEKQTSDLQRTEHAQPAIGTLSVGMYKILAQAGFKADFLAGHSFGELTALWAAGVLDDAGYYQLAKARGKAMAPPADPNFDAGGMLAVKGDIDKLVSLLPGFPEITLANYNSNQQVVLAGSKAAIKNAAEKLNAQGYSTVALPVSAAFHTSLVGHAQAPFAEEIIKVKFKKPQKPVFSNTTGKEYSEKPEEIQQVLTGHILHSVLFKDEVEAIYARGGRVFVEIGPKNVLTSLVKSILGERPHFALAVNANARKDSDIQLREAVLQLVVAGLSLQGFDPYAYAPSAVAPRKKSAATVILNGGLYTTPKTRQAFADALKSGPPVRASAPIPEPALVSQPAGSNGNGHKTAPAPMAGPRLDTRPAPASPAISQVKPEPSPSPKVEMDTSSTTMFYAHQKETLRIHEQYLQNQTEYARTFSTLMQTGFNMLGSQAAGASLETAARLLESVERSLAQFHEHQQETLRVHEQYLQSQSSLARDLFRAAFTGSAPAGDPIQAAGLAPSQEYSVPAESVIPIAAPVPVQPAPVMTAPASPAIQPAPVVEAPVPVTPVINPAAPGLDAAELKHSLLEIVSEKTGYPVDMIDPGMDMEADLGIDSIKRVEILGAMQVKYPELPKIPADALGDLRTLQMILARMEEALPAVAAAPAVAISASAPAVAPQPAVAAPASGGLDAQALTAALLEIVSEKTGYPQDMLDLNMDMEADLGIDSIKRVEILGAMQTRFPQLPKIGADRLSELHTLSQITAALNDAGSVTASPF
jgi:acyl transferase domain-containing protein